MIGNGNQCFIRVWGYSIVSLWNAWYCFWVNCFLKLANKDHLPRLLPLPLRLWWCCRWKSLITFKPTTLEWTHRYDKNVANSLKIFGKRSVYLGQTCERFCEDQPWWNLFTNVRFLSSRPAVNVQWWQVWKAVNKTKDEQWVGNVLIKRWLISVLVPVIVIDQFLEMEWFAFFEVISQGERSSIRWPYQYPTLRSNMQSVQWHQILESDLKRKSPMLRSQREEVQNYGMRILKIKDEGEWKRNSTDLRMTFKWSTSLSSFSALTDMIRGPRSSSKAK